MISPAFSSTRQAGAFALMLLLFLTLPVLAGKWLLPSREQMYSATATGGVDFPTYHKQFFEEKGDIDIAFMGSSRMGCAIDPVYVQEKLSEKLGRPAVVRELAWSWQGYDALYIIAQDLLEHRKVRMIVFNDLTPGATDLAHHQSSLWFRYGDNSEALAGLPLKSKASLYASAILGLPRNLVGLLRNNLPAYPTDKPDWRIPAVPYVPHSVTAPSDVLVYSEATRKNFRFETQPLPGLQEAFIRKIGRLASEYQAKLICLHIPISDERKETLVEEKTFWPDAFGCDVSMVGIPPATLFAGLSNSDIDKLFINSEHFNLNGANFFTALVTPDLIQIYEDQIKP